MSKIKVIVEIERRTYELLKEKPDNIAEEIIANGTPCNPSGDAISREAVRSEIWKERVEKDEGCNSEYIRGLKTAIGFIDNAQAIPLPNEQITWEQGYEAGLAQGKHDRPKGEWEEGTQGYYCSKCDYYDQSHFEHNFCPNCGADMRPKGGDPDEENS